MVPHILIAAALSGCSHMTNAGSEPTGLTVTGTSGDDDDNSSSNTDLTPAEAELAGDLLITKISIYQGVEAVLYEDGDAPNTLEMPVLTGRDAMLRVFVKPDAGFDPRKVDAILTVSDNEGDTVLESKLKVEVKSKDSDLDTTFNFDLPGDLLKQTTSMKVEIHELDGDAPGGGKNKDVTWRSDQHGGLDTEATDTLHVKVVPIKYNYDGSGRLPDTSDSQLQRIEEEVRQLYPAKDVVVTADKPYEWNKQIKAFDENQWTDILNAMVNYRGSKNEVPNTYYYGAFEPVSSINTFCAQGCILGLSYVGTANDDSLRASVGVGYTGSYTSDTLVHEMGHAHGRLHAPCGGATGTDPQYPYGGAKIGAWGNDILGGALKDPGVYVDMMSYCTPIWISDYNFYALFERMQTVANQARSAPTVRSVVRLGSDGVSTMGAPIELQSTEGADRVVVNLFDEAGEAAGTTTGAFLPLDHFAGGMVALDDELPPGWTAEVVSP